MESQEQILVASDIMQTVYKQQIDIVRGNIRRLMEKHEIASENALAKRAGVDQKTINNLLADDTNPNPTLKVLDAIAASFGISPWLLLLKDMPIKELGAAPLESISPESYQLLLILEKLPPEKRQTVSDFAGYQYDQIKDLTPEQIRAIARRYQLK